MASIFTIKVNCDMEKFKEVANRYKRRFVVKGLSVDDIDKYISIKDGMLEIKEYPSHIPNNSFRYLIADITRLGNISKLTLKNVLDLVSFKIER